MRAFLVWCVVCLIWSTTWIAIKIGLAVLPPLSFAGLRFLVAVTLLLALCAARRVPVPRSRRAILLLAGTGLLFFSLNFGLIFWGEQRISAGLAAVLQALIPAFGVVLAPVFLPQEQLSPSKLAALALGIGGVVLIFGNQLALAGRAALWGSLALVGSAAAVALSNVLVKTYGRDLAALTITTGQMVFGTVPLLVLGLLFEGSPLRFPWTSAALLALLYLAIFGSVVGLLLYYWVLKHMAVTQATLYAVVTPPLTVLLDAALLGQRLSWQTIVGGACIVASVAFLLTRRPAVRAAPATAKP